MFAVGCADVETEEVMPENVHSETDESNMNRGAHRHLHILSGFKRIFQCRIDPQYKGQHVPHAVMIKLRFALPCSCEVHPSGLHNTARAAFSPKSG